MTVVRLVPILLLLNALCLSAEDYLLTIGDKSYDIRLDEQQTITLPDGTQQTAMLRQREFQTWKSEFFEFLHRSSLRPSKTELDETISQTMFSTPIGTTVLLQEYSSMDPSLLIPLMVRELTEEEVSYGYTLEESSVEQQVGESSLKGTQAVTTLDDTRWVRCVYSYGNARKGVLIVTIIDTKGLKDEQYIIDEFWRSLKLKL